MRFSRLAGSLALILSLGLCPTVGAQPVAETPPDLGLCERSRQPDQAIVHQCLASPDAALRARAARAAGRLQDPAYLKDLVPLISDPESAVREEVLFALGQIPGGCSYLLTVDDPTALAALGRSGGPEALAVLEAALQSGDDSRLTAAAQALGVYALRRTRGRTELGEITPSTRAKLREMAQSLADEVRRAALYALYRWADVGAEKVLVALLDGPEPELALRVLSTFEHHAASRIARFKDSPRWVERYWAVRALLRVTPRSTALIPWLGDSSPHVRRALLQGLGSSARESTYLLAEELAWRTALDRASFDDEPSVAEAALLQLESFDLRLREARTSPRWQERRAAAHHSPDELLDDPDARVREVALQGTHRVDALVSALGSHDPMLSVAAAERLAALERTDMLAPVEAALDYFCQQGDSEPAQSLVAPVVALGGKDSARNLLQQPDHNLALAAAKALQIKEQPPGLAGTGPRQPTPIDPTLHSTRACLHTSRGDIWLRLLPEQAPFTVQTFGRRARSGFYRHLIFHRVVSDFVIQTGCPRGDGWGGAETIPCEINPVPYRRGTVGMALAGKDTGSSQFFVCHSPQPHLDGGYTVFAQVEQGLDVVDQIQEGDLLEDVEVATDTTEF